MLKDRVDNAESLRDALNRVVSGESAIDPEIVSRLVQGTTGSDSRYPEVGVTPGRP